MAIKIVCNIRGATIRSYQSCRKDLILLTEHNSKPLTFFQAYPAREKGYELSEDFRDYLQQRLMDGPGGKSRKSMLGFRPNALPS